MSEESVLSKWQQRLLPLMSSMLVLLTLFFCVGITVETYRVQKHLEEGHEIDLKPTFNLLAADQAKTFNDRMDLARFQTAALLESNALQSRYHQANVAQLMRICIIFLGFLTGMVLALVGAAFILGKLRESASNVSGEGAGWKLAVTSSSPGILLAVLGTSLMMATIWARVEVNVTDAALYFSSESVQVQRTGGMQTAPAGSPAPATEEIKRSTILKDLSEVKPK